MIVDGKRIVEVRLRGRRGFTLVELLVVIAIIAILAALLLPALKSVMENGRQTLCNNNLKQLNAGVTMYVNDWGYYPPLVYLDAGGNWNPTWIGLLVRDNYTASSLYDCPSCPVYTGASAFTGTVTSEYGYNYSDLSGKHIAKITSFSTTVLLGDSKVPPVSWGSNIFIKKGHYRSNSVAAPYAVADRHKNGCNILFADGHVLWCFAFDIDGASSWCP